MGKVITPADAFAAYERAFRAHSPREVEELLREMLNVQVAVVESKDSVEKELREGKQLKTVSVPYGVFLSRFRDKVAKTVYRLEPSAQKANTDFLVEVGNDEDIRPNSTYVLLSKEAGYSPERGLTFEGDGCETGFDPQPSAETREKTTTGRFQRWEEHAKGVWKRSERITKSFRPFIERWAKEALRDDVQLQSFVDSLIWAMRMAVYLHDVGKLNKQWQEVVWQNEQKVSGKTRDGYIARTSSLSNAEQKKELASPPPHAPFAYPFLQALLRKVLGDYRFLDTIALAAARHHSLEVTGAVEGGKFEWDEWNGRKANEWLQDQLCQLLDLSGDEVRLIQEAISEAAKRITEASKADEPPGPTDDFYFLYCITNRIVKICDWEDAGDKDIELR